MTPRGAEALFPELTRRFDGSTLLGYLNFSDGRPDPRFRKALAEVFGFLLSSGDPAPWVAAAGWLSARAGELEGSGPAAFRDLAQAKDVIPAAFRDLPAAYRRHHADDLGAEFARRNAVDQVLQRGPASGYESDEA